MAPASLHEAIDEGVELPEAPQAIGHQERTDHLQIGVVVPVGSAAEREKRFGRQPRIPTRF
jgi:hypothetical protein